MKDSDYRKIAEDLDESGIAYLDKDGIYVRYYELVKPTDDLDALVKDILGIDDISDVNVEIRADTMHGRIIIDKR